MKRGVHLNKSHLDLMQNRGGKAIDFYCECKKVWPLRIWSHRTVECLSNQSTPRLPWLLGLEWNKYRKDLSQPHKAFKSQACHGGQKLFFRFLLCLAFLSPAVSLTDAAPGALYFAVIAGCVASLALAGPCRVRISCIVVLPLVIRWGHVRANYNSRDKGQETRYGLITQLIG